MASVLITGASRGIGFETALAFGRAGYQVQATMRDPSRSPALAETAARERLPIVVSAMDVNSDASVSEAIAGMRAGHGPIDVLVNNAGVASAGAVEESPLAEFRVAMETNYFGALRCIQALVPEMRARRSGCIISVSSVAGRVSNPPLTAYCASKWALEALSEGLAAEMKSFNVRVALVEPGVIDTDMARHLGDGEQSRPASLYGHTARFETLFAHALKTPVSPSLVAEKILEIAASGTWQLRHQVGVGSLLALRAQMSDEDWIEMNAADDATFFARMAAPV